MTAQSLLLICLAAAFAMYVAYAHEQLAQPIVVATGVAGLLTLIVLAER